MGWVITHDHLAEPEENDQVGWGQSWPEVGAYEAVRRLPLVGCFQEIKFRLYDDDGILYYSGVMSHQLLSGDEMYAFAPLDYYKNDSGCTEMRYEEDEQWKTL